MSLDRQLQHPPARRQRLLLIGRLGLAFATQAVYVIAAGTDGEIVRRLFPQRIDRKPCKPFGTRRSANTAAGHVACQQREAMQQDRHLLIPVGIQRRAALLLQHTQVMLLRAKIQARKVAFHGRSLIEDR